MAKNPGGRPPLFVTPDDMQQAIDQYYDECDVDEQPLTMSGLAIALDMCRKSLTNYTQKDKFLPVIRKAKARVENQVEKSLLAGNAPAGSIFWLKNNAEWVDKTEQTIKSESKVEVVGELGEAIKRALEDNC